MQLRFVQQAEQAGAMRPLAVGIGTLHSTYDPCVFFTLFWNIFELGFFLDNGDTPIMTSVGWQMMKTRWILGL